MADSNADFARQLSREAEQLEALVSKFKTGREASFSRGASAVRPIKTETAPRKLVQTGGNLALVTADD